MGTAEIATMSYTSLSQSNPSALTNNTKVIALETSLNQSVVNFQDLVLDLQQLHIDTETYRLQYLSVKEKCENKACIAAEELQKIIATKDHIIHAVASTLTKLNETKDFNILTEVFKILFDEVTPLTPPTEDTSPKTRTSDDSNKAVNPNNKDNTCEADTSITEDASNKEESLSEIEGTPTGRTSPIIQTKNRRNISSKTEVRDKKKCPDDWPTSGSKTVRLIFPKASKTPKGSGKLRQSRLKLLTLKTSTVVDLTCSPEVLAQKQENFVQPLVKKESMEDDTILPSPTSGPASISLYKTTSKASPSKFKKPKPLSLKSRCENIKQDENKDTSNNATKIDMDESINILNNFSNRLRDMKKESSVQKDSPVKTGKGTPIKKEQITPVKKEKESANMEVLDEDATNASITMQDDEQLEEHKKAQQSPPKRPLAENMNIVNTPPRDPESSLSILRPEPAAAVEAVKRKIPELVEPVYKEAAVRKKTEKRNLQGWSCEECMNFYGILYKDDPVMLAKKIQDCSKHRGRHNPARPKTPPNFWNPRWTVPEDTEELNRMNNGG